nr:MAG TPA: hypothetical protein [Caudoviricetes sp.]
MRKQCHMLSILVCIASGAHNGYYVKLPVVITVLTMIGILIHPPQDRLQMLCHCVNGLTY